MCDNFEQELAAILDSPEYDDIEYQTIPSKCFCRKSQIELSDVSFEPNETVDRTVIIGGNCIENISNANMPGTRIISHEQCFHLLTNYSIVDHFQNTGSYITSPGWLSRWEDIVHQWGMDSDVCREMFNETSQNILMLDTEVWRDSEKHLKEFSEYAGLPAERLTVGLDLFRSAITAVINEWRKSREDLENIREISNLLKQKSEYVFALEIINELAHTFIEEMMLEKLEDIFITLFAPGQYRLILKTNSKVHDIEPSSELHRAITLFENSGNKPPEFALTGSGNGFILPLKTDKKIFGYILADDLQFPQYINNYINLAISVLNVCGLSLQNAELINALENRNEELNETNEALKAALEEIQTLEKFIPICAYCKKVRTDEGYWEQVEEYITSRTGSTFSHGICQDCMVKHYPELMDDEENA